MPPTRPIRTAHGEGGSAGTFVPRLSYSQTREGSVMILKFLLWCVLLILCWPLALLALVLYPIVWLLLLPFRLLGIAVHGALDLVAAL